MKKSNWMVLLAAAVLCSSAAARDGVTRLAAASHAPEKRNALVIGNGNYADGALKNPLNDARAVALQLAASGFEVLLLEDGSQAGMRRAIRQFGDLIEQGGVGLFYYAGHGLQVKGRNFLVPVNADIDREYEVEFTAIDVNMVLSVMDAAKNPLNIVILDACRNNPFARSLRVGSSGLAPMDAPAGTFIAFATAPGAIASDGSGGHGVYTKHLLAHVGKPGMPIEQLFKQVRIGVMEETRGEQTPWESSSLRGDFAFRQGVAADDTAGRLVAEALRRDRETYARERQAMIEAALERQRRELQGHTASARAADRTAYRVSSMRGGSREYGLEDAQLASYLVSLDGQLPQGRRPSRMARLDSHSCSEPYLCRTRGRVVGSEVVTVDAGRFETVKLVIEQDWQPIGVGPGVSSQYGEMFGQRVITVWYSPEAKRAVKVSSRIVNGRNPPMDGDYELQLVAYPVGGPSTARVALHGEAK